jgi:hypothetical protein
MRLTRPFGSLEKMLQLVRSARPAWLIVALFVQAGTYVSAAFVWRQALNLAGHPLPMRTLVPLGIAKVFTDQVLPSGGISGTMLMVRGLIRRHVPPEIAIAAMLIGLVSYDIAYLIVVLASAGMLWLQHRLNLPLLIGVTIFVVVTVAVPAAVLGLKKWGKRRPIAWVSKCLGVTTLLRELTDAPTDLLRSPRLLLQTVGLQLCIFISRCVHALACVQRNRRGTAALGSIRQLRHRLDGSDDWTHSCRPGDVRSRICRHVQPARRVGGSGAGRDAPAARTDLLAPDVARHLACATRDQTRVVTRDQHATADERSSAT